MISISPLGACVCVYEGWMEREREREREREIGNFLELRR